MELIIYADFTSPTCYLASGAATVSSIAARARALARGQHAPHLPLLARRLAGWLCPSAVSETMVSARATGSARPACTP